jgi:hypothetical protein
MSEFSADVDQNEYLQPGGTELSAIVTVTAIGKATADVALRLWTPQGSKVAFVKQVAPTIEDLTDRAILTRKPDGELDPLTVEFPTGAAWGEESREYYVCLLVPARKAGDEALAGRVKLMVDGEAVSEAKIRAIWTDEVRRWGSPDDPPRPGVREPRRPTPTHGSGAIQLPPPDNAA